MQLTVNYLLKNVQKLFNLLALFHALRKEVNITEKPDARE